MLNKLKFPDIQLKPALCNYSANLFFLLLLQLASEVQLSGNPSVHQIISPQSGRRWPSAQLLHSQLRALEVTV